MKKKVNVFLIIAVVSLWAIVGYRIIGAYFFDVKNESVFLNDYGKHQFKLIEKDTFKLLAVKRDPFLNKMVSEKNEKKVEINAVIPIKKKINSIKKENLEIPFPVVHYYGYIKSEKKKDEMVILKINNQMKRLRRNETFIELKIVEVFKDSIKLSNGHQIKTFFKS